MGSALYVLYATIRFSDAHLWGQYFYVAPIVIPFVAFIFDRAERIRQLTAIHFIIDGLVIGTAMWRVIGHVPYVSGHSLFLTYALLSARSRVAQITAAIVMLQVIYLKYIVWGDWVTSTTGIVLGSMAALISWRLGINEDVERMKPKPTG